MKLLLSEHIYIINHYSNILEQCFPKFLFADPFWLQKITTGLHTLPNVNIVCPDDRYPILKFIFLNCFYIVTSTYLQHMLTIHCMMSP